MGVSFRRRRILFTGFEARMEDTKTAEVRDVQRNDGARGLRGGAGEKVDGVSPERAESAYWNIYTRYIYSTIP